LPLSFLNITNERKKICRCGNLRTKGAEIVKEKFHISINARFNGKERQLLQSFSSLNFVLRKNIQYSKHECFCVHGFLLP